MLLGGVLMATRNAGPLSVPVKGKGGCAPPWVFQVRQPQDLARDLGPAYRALWQAQLNLGDLAFITSPRAADSLNAETFMTLVGNAEVNAKSVSNTEELVSRGVLGATSLFVGAPMSLGQGRL